MLTNDRVLPVALTTSPAGLLRILVPVAACALLKAAPFATELCLACLLAAATAGVAFAMASLAAGGIGVLEGDLIDLGNGERARVRAVRWCYTVVDTDDDRTLLVPNRRFLAIPGASQRVNVSRGVPRM